MKKIAFIMVIAAFAFASCGTSTPKQQEAQEEVVLEQEAVVTDSIAEVVEEAAEEVVAE